MIWQNNLHFLRYDMIEYKKKSGKFSRKEGVGILDSKGSVSQKGSVIGVLDDEKQVHYFMFVSNPEAIIYDQEAQKPGKTGLLGAGFSSKVKFAVSVKRMGEKQFQKLEDQKLAPWVVRIHFGENSEDSLKTKIKKQQMGYSSPSVFSVMEDYKKSRGMIKKSYMVLPYLGRSLSSILLACARKEIPHLTSLDRLDSIVIMKDEGKIFKRKLEEKIDPEVVQAQLRKDLIGLKQFIQLIEGAVNVAKNFHEKRGYAHNDLNGGNITLFKQNHTLVAHLIDFDLIAPLEESSPKAVQLKKDNLYLARVIFRIFQVYRLVMPNIQLNEDLDSKLRAIEVKAGKLALCGQSSSVDGSNDGVSIVEAIQKDCKSVLQELNNFLGNVVDEREGLLFPLIEEEPIKIDSVCKNEGKSIREPSDIIAPTQSSFFSKMMDRTVEYGRRNKVIIGAISTGMILEVLAMTAAYEFAKKDLHEHLFKAEEWDVSRGEAMMMGIVILMGLIIAVVIKLKPVGHQELDQDMSYALTN